MDKLALFTLLAMLTFACTPKQESKNGYSTSYAGYYVSAQYGQRNEGYDWTGISVRQANDSTYSVSIRSRADLKKPSCTFDGVASEAGSNKLKSLFENRPIIFAFSEGQLEVSMENEADEGFLHLFCSGGASIKGTYKKLNESMDMAQLNGVAYEQVLSLQGIAFLVKSIHTGFGTKLTVEPSNLKIDNRPFEQTINGYVAGAEIEDMNSDGFPELLIYTNSMDGGIFGNVIGFSVNNGKSMSQIYFTSVKDNPKINQGYYGYDGFTMVETKLGQRFPLFEEVDGKQVRTGKMRQITYTLEDGEAQRLLKVDQISEY